MTVTLLWVDCEEWTAGWIAQSRKRRTRGEKEEENLVFRESLQLFICPRAGQGLKGITSVSFNPFLSVPRIQKSEIL